MTFSQQNQNAQESESDSEFQFFAPTSAPTSSIAIQTSSEEDFSDIVDDIKKNDLVTVFGDYMRLSHIKFNTKEIINWIYHIMNAFALKINWTLISKRKDLSEEPKKQLDWEVLSRYLLFTNNIVSTMRGLIQWEIFSKRKLSHNFLKTASSRVDWKLVCQYSNLDDTSIRLFKDEFTNNDAWDVIVRYQELSAEILEEFIGKFDFGLVKKFQKKSVAILGAKKLQGSIKIHAILENELKDVVLAVR
jgi:hypothetical protein